MKKIYKAFTSWNACKTNSIGFTYIELLVVIWIIVLISSTWVFYFLDYINEQEINQKLSLIKQDFKDLNKQINNYNVFDYEIKMNTINLKKWYIVFLNNFNIDYRQDINFDSETWSWTIFINWDGTINWYLKIYKNLKLILGKSIESDIIFNYDFVEDQNYTLLSKIWPYNSNEIKIKYFTENNVLKENNTFLVLTNINTNFDKSWTSITNLSIKNIWWKKTIIWDWISYDEVYVFFESNWKEGYLKLLVNDL